jgi:hypothetical protein
MNRFFIAGLLALAASSPAFAQDMPLSQILIDGEGWKKTEDATPAERKGIALHKKAQASGLSCWAFSPDGSVVYYAMLANTSITAAQVYPDKDAPHRGANSYCPLRLKQGTKEGGCTALCVDNDGRLYAATPVGVQVFDPTGRLCGVMVSPPLKVDYISFQGDMLTLWVGEQKYARKLNTQGVK